MPQTCSGFDVHETGQACRRLTELRAALSLSCVCSVCSLPAGCLHGGARVPQRARLADRRRPLVAGGGGSVASGAQGRAPGACSAYPCVVFGRRGCVSARNISVSGAGRGARSTPCSRARSSVFVCFGVRHRHRCVALHLALGGSATACLSRGTRVAGLVPVGERYGRAGAPRRLVAELLHRPRPQPQRPRNARGERSALAPQNVLRGRGGRPLHRYSSGWCPP